MSQNYQAALTKPKLATKLGIGLAIGLLALQTNVQAANVSSLTITSVPPSDTISFKLGSTTETGVYADAFKLSATVAGSTSSFLAYCIDPYQQSTLNTAYTDYMTTTLDQAKINGSTLGSTKLGLIEALYNKAFGSIDASNATDTAAFQLALWEIIVDGGSSLNLSSGSFQVTSWGGDSSLQSEATTLLSGLSATTQSAYSFTVYHSDNEQDFLVATSQGTITTPVPEPSNAALLLAGLGGMGLYARRRMNKKTDA